MQWVQPGIQVFKMSPHRTALNLGLEVTKHPVPFQVRSQLLSFPAYNSIIQSLKFPLSLHLCQVLLIAKEKDVKLSRFFLSNS